MMQTMDKDANDDAVIQTRGNNANPMTQPQILMPRHSGQGDATTSRKRGMGGHGTVAALARVRVVMVALAVAVVAVK